MLAAGYLLLVLVAAAPEAETDAGQKPVEVQFEGPAGCGGAGAFFASLRSRTAHVRAAEGTESRTTLQVRLTRERGRVVGELRTIDDSGASDSRKVQGTSCDDVVQALSLTAALALDPTAVLSVSPDQSDANAAASGNTAGAPAASMPGPERGTVAEKSSKPAEEQKAPAPVVEAPGPSPSRPVPSVELGAGLIGLSLLSGDFNPGMELDLRKNLGSGGVFRPALGIALLYARNDGLQSPSDAAAALVAVAASVCPLRVTASFLTVQPCGAMWGGLLRTAGRQLTHEDSVNRMWLSAGPALRLLAFLGHGLSLQLEGGLQALLIKRRYFATVPRNVIAETPSVSPFVGIGLTYGF